MFRYKTEEQDRCWLFFSSRRRHTRWPRDWSSDVCSSDLEQRLALPARCFDAAGKHQGVAIHNEAVLGPKIEMSNPHLLVDQRDELLHLAAAALRHFQFEGAGEMQRLDVVHPGVRDLVVGPFPARQDRDLVLARALE